MCPALLVADIKNVQHPSKKQLKRKKKKRCESIKNKNREGT